MAKLQPEKYVGQTIRSLEVISVTPPNIRGNTMVEILCYCGTVKVVILSELLNGITKSCGCSQKTSVIAVGEKHSSQLNGDFEVVVMDGWDKVEVVFLLTGFRKNTRVATVISGNIRDPYYPMLYGVGYLGEGEARTSGKYKTCYNTWCHMLERCYSNEFISKNRLAYEDVTVCEDWYCYNTFAKWFMEHKVRGYHLDKDFTVIGNRIYHPLYCKFIPAHLNAIFTGYHNDLINMGVSLQKSGRYKVSLNVNKTQEYLGTYPCWLSAKKAYLISKRWEVQKLHNTYPEGFEEIFDNLYKLCDIDFYTKT